MGMAEESLRGSQQQQGSRDGIKQEEEKNRSVLFIPVKMPFIPAATPTLAPASSSSSQSVVRNYEATCE